MRIQPGVVLSQLNRFLADRGRLFGPDPATGNVSTMGSVLALDGSGSHWLRYGSAGDAVVSLQVVLADGSVMEAGTHAWTSQPQDDPAGRSTPGAGPRPGRTLLSANRR